MDMTQIINRLRDQAAGVFKSIDGAAELDAAIASAPVTPSAWAIPLAERPLDPHLADQSAQIVMLHFSVVICVANRRDATGAAAVQGLQPLRQAVRAALLGWAPNPDDGNAVTFTGGRLLLFADQRMWWADEFAVMTEIEGPIQ
jgi:hypothetical protein